MFLCKFKHKRDKNKVIKGGSWIFDDVMILFEEPKGNCSINALEFKYALFWVHFHNIPRVCFCRKYAEALENTIGVFKGMEAYDNDKISGELLRVRIRIDTKEPLKSGMNVKVGSGVW